MVRPLRKSEDPIQGAVMEIISGISSLNMEPRPIRRPQGDYLSQRDYWARHSVVHFEAAIDYLRRADGVRQSIDAAIGILEAGAAGDALLILKIAQAKLKGKKPPYRVQSRGAR